MNNALPHTANVASPCFGRRSINSGIFVETLF